MEELEELRCFHAFSLGTAIENFAGRKSATSWNFGLFEAVPL